MMMSLEDSYAKRQYNSPSVSPIHPTTCVQNARQPVNHFAIYQKIFTWSFNVYLANSGSSNWFLVAPLPLLSALKCDCLKVQQKPWVWGSFIYSTGLLGCTDRRMRFWRRGQVGGQPTETLKSKREQEVGELESFAQKGGWAVLLLWILEMWWERDMVVPKIDNQLAKRWMYITID